VLDALALGARHGWDPDHLAAIAELTASQRGGWHGFVLGIRYALGHAATVALLGLVASEAGLSTPDWLIGLTLVGLGGWALWRLVLGHTHEHAHEPSDDDHLHHHPEEPTGPHRHRHRHAVAVGALHGLGGAPAAILVGGQGRVALLVFTGGLLVSNGVVGAIAGATTRVAVVAWAGAVAGTVYGMFLMLAG
jgi:hypothetical protein